MSRHWARASLLLMFTAATNVVAACASSADSSAPPEALPCDVARSLARRCQICHSSPPAPGVPFSLMTLDDTRRTTRLNRSGIDAPIWQSMREVLEDGRMPLDPRTGTPAPLSLEDPDRAVILSWVTSGAPGSMAEVACGGS